MSTKLEQWEQWGKAAGFVVALVGLAIVNGCTTQAEENRARLQIVQYVDHPALDACRSGFMAELERLGYKDGKNIVVQYENAQGDPNLARAIAEKVAAKRPTLVFSLATPMTQSVKHALHGTKVPIVFGAITDPISAGLVESMEKPGDAITGTSDRWPYREQLELLKEAFPKVERVCVVFNPGEDNTRYAMDQTRAAATAVGVDLVEAAVSTGSEVVEAAQSIASRCQAFYVPADNTAMAGAPSIVKVANRFKLPIIAGDPETFKAGSVVGFGVSYEELGVASARLADQILKGATAGELPVVTSSEGFGMVNLAVASKLRVKLPEAVVQRAKVVIK
jgi:putative tryptophan/tyrosine transport system substrate-binding protein